MSLLETLCEASTDGEVDVLREGVRLLPRRSWRPRSASSTVCPKWAPDSERAETSAPDSYGARRGRASDSFGECGPRAWRASESRLVQVLELAECPRCDCRRNSHTRSTDDPKSRLLRMSHLCARHGLSFITIQRYLRAFQWSLSVRGRMRRGSVRVRAPGRCTSSDLSAEGSNQARPPGFRGLRGGRRRGRPGTSKAGRCSWPPRIWWCSGWTIGGAGFGGPRCTQSADDGIPQSSTM